MYRMANFLISKNLDKAEKMPNYRQWKVSENDRCVEGPILLYIRSKGWFFDRVCQPGVRYCVLTNRGFLLIYMRDEKGFVLDMRRAYEITSNSDNVSVLKKKYRRCRIKIRYTFGTVNIILTNGKIDLWRDRLLNATNAPATAALTRQLALPPCDPDYLIAAAYTPLRPGSSMYGPLDNVEMSPSLVALKSFSTAISDEEEVSKRENWARVRTPVSYSEPSDASVFTALDVSTCDDDYQCLTSRLPLIEEEDTSVVAETCASGLFNYNSIRESTVPVGWLRRQLEHKIVADRRRPMYVATPTTPAAKDEEEVSSTAATSSEAVLPKAYELPTMTFDVVAPAKAPKTKKQVKFSKKRSTPIKATARSVPSDSSSGPLTRFNSFQFWRSSAFESDV